MTTRIQREDGTLAQEDVDELLDKIDGTGNYLKAVSNRQDNPRWILSVSNGYRWLTPAIGRRHTTGRGDTRTTLRHYDTVQVVSAADVPSQVEKMGQGLAAFTGGDD